MIRCLKNVLSVFSFCPHWINLIFPRAYHQMDTSVYSLISRTKANTTSTMTSWTNCNTPTGTMRRFKVVRWLSVTKTPLETRPWGRGLQRDQCRRVPLRRLEEATMQSKITVRSMSHWFSDSSHSLSAILVTQVWVSFRVTVLSIGKINFTSFQTSSSHFQFWVMTRNKQPCSKVKKINKK